MILFTYSRIAGQACGAVIYWKSGLTVVPIFWNPYTIGCAFGLSYRLSPVAGSRYTSGYRK